MQLGAAANRASLALKGMDSERPPSSRTEAFSGSSVESARGVLRESLGAVRNLVQLLHSLRVAPKSLSQVLPDVRDACPTIRSSVQTLLAPFARVPEAHAARAALEAFFEPRISELEAALSAAMDRPLNAKSRLALEEAVSKCSFELDGARGLLQLLEDAVCERPVRLDPRELVREALLAPPDAQREGPPIMAVLAVQSAGADVELSPRVTMTLIGLGVELVAARRARETPYLEIATDALGTCTVQVRRLANVSGEPLKLRTRGILAPTLLCLRAAAALTGGEIDWNPTAEEFRVSYPLGGGAVRAG